MSIEMRPRIDYNETEGRSSLDRRGRLIGKRLSIIKYSLLSHKYFSLLRKAKAIREVNMIRV
jgi:hypothetical protein